MRTFRLAARRLDVTACYLAALSLTTVFFNSLGAAEQRRLLLSSSTNLHHLGLDPVRVLVASILWESPAAFVAVVLPTALLLGVIEWRIGSWRSLLVLATGHIGATLLAAIGIAAGIRAGTLAPAVGHSVDVGTSYATFALLSYGAVLVDDRRVRALLVAAIAVSLVVVIAVDRDFTSFGHLFAAAIGLTLAVAGFGRPGARGRRAALALVTLCLVAAPLAGWIEQPGPPTAAGGAPAIVKSPGPAAAKRGALARRGPG